MFGIGGWEMLLIGVVALLVFGPKRLPELARSMGKGLAEFRRASSDLRRTIDLDADLGLDSARISAPDPATRAPAQTGDVSDEKSEDAKPDSETAATAAAETGGPREEETAAPGSGSRREA